MKCHSTESNDKSNKPIGVEGRSLGSEDAKNGDNSHEAEDAPTPKRIDTIDSDLTASFYYPADDDGEVGRALAAVEQAKAELLERMQARKAHEAENEAANAWCNKLSQQEHKSGAVRR